MKTSKSISRRNFIGKAAATAGLTALGSKTLFGKQSECDCHEEERLPREVWIATVSQEGLSGDTPEQVVQTFLSILNKSLAYRPDIICLPEIFMFTWIRQRLTLNERADKSLELLKEFMNFARTNSCYIICPTVTREDGKLYNSAVLIDRQGNPMGEYHKMHLPLDELNAGYTPGSLNPPVFKTDFGTIGIQICYDVNWNDGWHALRQQGAEIVFWPSAYPGGRKINAKAFQNKNVVVTSTRGLSKICDITGDVIAQTNDFDKNLICAPVNLDKAIFNSWPNDKYFNEIRTKYGQKVKITSYFEEGWTTIESLSAEVRVNDLVKEYNMMTFERLAHETDVISEKRRN